MVLAMMKSVIEWEKMEKDAESVEFCVFSMSSI